MYYIKLEDNKIVGYLEGEKLDNSYVEVDKEEYNKAFMYCYFNKHTREFSVLKEVFKSNLEIQKTTKVEESKTALANWLQENPLTSSVHNGAAVYSVTEEKQALLTRNLTLANLKNSDTTTWNCQGGICEEWTVQELSQLALEIEAYVRPRIKKQQTYEVQINTCTTVEEVEAIEIEYDTI